MTALVVAAVVAVLVALVTSRVLELQWLGPWGLVYGGVAFVAAFGLTLIVLASGLRRLGWSSLAVAAMLLSIGSWSWIVGWGVPPTTLEGLWMWPFAVGTLLLAVVAIVRSLGGAKR